MESALFAFFYLESLLVMLIQIVIIGTGMNVSARFAKMLFRLLFLKDKINTRFASEYVLCVLFFF